MQIQPYHDALAEFGVFMPNAEILCERCTDKNGAYMSATRKPPEDTDLARCDACSASIWVRSDVATLQRLRDVINALNDGYQLANMRQTDGMCSALVIELSNDDIARPRQLWFTDAEKLDADGDRFTVGLYTETDEDGGPGLDDGYTLHTDATTHQCVMTTWSLM